jgi:hypothetical protein
VTYRDTSADVTLDNAKEGIMSKSFEEWKKGYPLDWMDREAARDAWDARQPEIDALKAEVAHWKANHDNMVSRSRVLMDRTDLPLDRVRAFEQIGKLQAENERLLKDAQRYRWLRSRDLDTISIGGVFAGITPDNVVVNGDDLDKHIDAAMKDFSTTTKEER